MAIIVLAFPFTCFSIFLFSTFLHGGSSVHQDIDRIVIHRIPINWPPIEWIAIAPTAIDYTACQWIAIHGAAISFISIWLIVIKGIAIAIASSVIQPFYRRGLSWS
jgi:hypothetical protein